MIPALILLCALAVVGIVCYLLEVRHRRIVKDSVGQDGAPAEDRPDEEAGEQCCGMHITCEKDSLLTAVNPVIEYYDDEELDAYLGTAPDEYSDEAVEEFRNVLLTLRPEEIAGWARSIQLRGISLPSAVREELLMIVAEARQQATHTDKTDKAS